MVDPGPVGEADLPTDLYRAAMTTRVGSSSRPVPTDSGFSIVKVLDRQQSRSFDQARGSIITELTREYRRSRITEELNRLKTKFGVTVADDLPTIRLQPYIVRIGQAPPTPPENE